MSIQLTYKFRLKDSCNSELVRQAKVVNFVWNYCNERQKEAVSKRRKWLSKYDLQKLTAGSSIELNVHAHTIQGVCRQYERSRIHTKKPWLKWRSNKKSLGWIPFNKGHVVYKGGAFIFRGRSYKAWVSRSLEDGQTFSSGSFNQDSQGHWFINLPLDVEDRISVGEGSIGIDLGLKDMANMSNGCKIEHPHYYKRIEQRIAISQRANHKRKTRKLHAKAKAQRNDFLHKASTELVRQYGAIFIGNIKPSAIAKTSMSKTSFDAGWAQFKTMLEYKAIRHQVLFAEVNEAYTTQTCSQCGSIEGPKGVAGLGIRRWTCRCGADHDRDTNAAQNIVARGLASLAEGASV
jgi:putative transposase